MRKALLGEIDIALRYGNLFRRRLKIQQRHADVGINLPLQIIEPVARLLQLRIRFEHLAVNIPAGEQRDCYRAANIKDAMVGSEVLAGVTVVTADGTALSLQRGQGGLDAVERNAEGEEHHWKILGASRGEGGILGEGIRQALLRDSTYLPALTAARGLCPA